MVNKEKITESDAELMVREDELPLVDSLEYSMVVKIFEEFISREKTKDVNKTTIVLIR